MIKEINIAQIEMDRHPLNPSTLSLIEHIRDGGSIPPIHEARHAGGNFLIRDGRHRITACKLLGIKTIKARVNHGNYGRRVHT